MRVKSQRWSSRNVSPFKATPTGAELGASLLVMHLVGFEVGSGGLTPAAIAPLNTPLRHASNPCVVQRQPLGALQLGLRSQFYTNSIIYAWQNSP